MNDQFGFDDGPDTDIDLTPLIDVVFILIIFFVIATSFSKPVLEIILPAAETSEVEVHRQGEVMVDVDADGAIYSGGVLYTEDNIMDLMNTDVNSTMVLNMDKEAPFESFILIIDSARKIDRNNIVVATDEKEE
ncbi:biopolymer transporter ExbD [Candidatus Fermentibacteria bacterium]|nr:MAG: biopolymer transporter ExbD [Candidatus Fermentibacteria bacterium]